MHIMTTMRCNMTCAHCCYACESTGKDMSFKTLKASVDLAVSLGHRVALAGGEPTVHPLFWDFVEYAISQSNDFFIQTNGKKTNTALALAKMAAAGLIISGISQDEWHEPIDPTVIMAFTKEKYSPGDKRFIRDIGWNSQRGPQKAGRCDWGVELCPCLGCAFIDVDGNIHECGCSDAPVIGSVFKPDEFISQCGYYNWRCWKGLGNPESSVSEVKEETVAS